MTSISGVPRKRDGIILRGRVAHRSWSMMTKGGIA
jgi:hypothetical protein